MTKDANDMNLDELAQQMHLRPDSIAHLGRMLSSYGGKPMLNSRRRMPRSSLLGPMAAKASIKTADAAKKNAKYMLASVIVAAISALALAVSACYSYWNVVNKN